MQQQQEHHNHNQMKYQLIEPDNNNNNNNNTTASTSSSTSHSSSNTTSTSTSSTSTTTPSPNASTNNNNQYHLVIRDTQPSIQRLSNNSCSSSNSNSPGQTHHSSFNCLNSPSTTSTQQLNNTSSSPSSANATPLVESVTTSSSSPSTSSTSSFLNLLQQQQQQQQQQINRQPGAVNSLLSSPTQQPHQHQQHQQQQHVVDTFFQVPQQPQSFVLPQQHQQQQQFHPHFFSIPKSTTPHFRASPLAPPPLLPHHLHQHQLHQLHRNNNNNNNNMTTTMNDNTGGSTSSSNTVGGQSNNNPINSSSGAPFSLTSSYNQLNSMLTHSQNMSIQQMVNSGAGGPSGNTTATTPTTYAGAYEDAAPLSVSYENLFNNIFSGEAKPLMNDQVIMTLGSSANNNNISNTPSSAGTSSSSNNNNHHAHHAHGANGNGVVSATPSSDISSPSPPSASHHSSSSPLQQYSPLPSPSHTSSSTHAQHNGTGNGHHNHNHNNNNNNHSSNIHHQQHHSSPMSPSTSNSSPLSNADYHNQQQQQGGNGHMQHAFQPNPNIAIPSSPSMSTRKLKREFEQIQPKDEWESYYPTNSKLYTLFDSKNELTGSFNFKVKRTDKNIQFSELDSAWILYRQNRFQVDCDLTGYLETWNNTDRSNLLYVNNDANALTEVSGLYFTLYVLKFNSPTTTNIPNDPSDRVPIHQLGNASGKKDGRLPVEACPVLKGKSNWTKLQFGSATANNARIHPEQPNPNQQFFRIVVTLNAVVDAQLHTASSTQMPFTAPPSPTSQFYPILAKISPAMIVRGQNPGRFLNHDKSSKRDSGASPNGAGGSFFNGHFSIQGSGGSSSSGGSSGGSSSGRSSAQFFGSGGGHHHSLGYDPNQQQSGNPTIVVESVGVGQAGGPPNIRLSTSSMVSSTSSSGSESDSNSNTNPQYAVQQQQQQQQQQYSQGMMNPFNHNGSMLPNNSVAQPTTVPTQSPVLVASAIQQQQQQDVNTNAIPFQHLQQQQLFLKQQQLPITVGQAQVQFQQQPPLQQQQQQQQFVPMEEPYTIKTEPWSKHPHADDVVFTNAKVGINTTNPTQALSVNGNILVTGDLFKPSDRRIKTNIQRDTSNHWANIDKLKLYEYDRKKMVGYDAPNHGAGKLPAGTTVRETGFMAQELKEVIPNAVTVAGEVRLQDGTVIPNLLVVNDRILLLENIGATQQIGRTLQREQDHIVEMDKEINKVKIDGKRDQHVILNKMQDLVSFMLSEEGKHKSHDDSCVYCSLMGLGPAWTMFVFGFFVPFFWLFGSFFLFSPSRVKWISGLVNFITTIIYVIVAVLLTLMAPDLAFAIILPSFCGMGILCCIVVGFFRQRTWESKSKYYRERMRLMQKDGYENLNEQIDKIRRHSSASMNSAGGSTSSSSRSSQSIDMTPISEMHTSCSQDIEEELLSTTSASATAAGAKFQPEVDTFREISMNNHKTLQEIPLQKIVSNYGKRQKPKTKQTYTTTTSTTTTTTTSEEAV
ncbi:hypothetical protein SAMD00019534_100430 [Acytostelium subglobosum LB1]|uniref:hypothetical protein n=1 Tax=Acytostelium subglobosum LB1 TaxID=1410327 RepID=UPI000644A5A1|nr:hypothetical protein SAMD00019534_100430 [Acytostelium subglobosum LB1]GAM26868.1 hypothetical protein SAMD00019534_100430 [Acytostelium subglobosum LB1]|eukprot:XP_012750136.1 hypothetical protein SAMD00019534_100430 [Acytostelium subglobosum LB1]